MTGERGDIVIGWLARIAVVLGLAGVLLFDVVSIGLAGVGAQDDATNAALEASEAYLGSRGNADAAWAAAVRYAEGRGARIDPESFRIGPDGRVHLRVEKTARTMVVRHIRPLEGLAVVDATGDGRSVPS